MNHSDIYSECGSTKSTTRYLLFYLIFLINTLLKNEQKRESVNFGQVDCCGAEGTTSVSVDMVSKHEALGPSFTICKDKSRQQRCWCL